MDAPHRVNLADKLEAIREAWSPRIVSELNGQYVKLAWFEGEYVWHHHAAEDEFFLVIQGEIEIHFRDRVVRLREGECCVVPRGVEHKPVAAGRAGVLVFEPASTRNTGNVSNDRTIEPNELKRI